MVYVIATIKEGNKYVGFMVLDTDRNLLLPTTYEELYNELKYNNFKVENVKLVGDKITAKIGSLKDYTELDNHLEVIGHKSIVVLGATADNGILCSDYRGTLEITNEESLLRYCSVMYSQNDSSNRLANCKIQNNRIVLS